MHPPRGSRQSKHRSAVAQKGPARHLTCWRAPGAGLSLAVSNWLPSSAVDSLDFYAALPPGH